ncbi:MAG: response regulator [Lachnospiraceae bacterium]|nr:response regulator [Lachnospiraceae bacterium]
MRKILFVGKMNQIMKDLHEYLEPFFHVQICAVDRSTMAGMLDVTKPEMVLISLIGVLEMDGGIFTELSIRKEKIPVLTIGTEEECNRFLKYYESSQFTNLVRPVANRSVLEGICTCLGLNPQEVARGEIEDKPTRKRVLVIDDEATTLRSIKGMLDDAYEVMIATSGVKAMTMMGKKRPDIVLLDYEMPVVDGRQTLEMMKSEEDLKDIPVVFLTSVNDRENIEAVLKLQPAGYMLKPARKDKLHEKIAEVLN